MRAHITRASAAATAGAMLSVLGLAGAVAATSMRGHAHPVTAYVVNQFSDTVIPIRTATNTALKPIKVGHSPDAIAITPNGKTAYVGNQGAGTVTPIRTATNTALKDISVGGGARGVADIIAITPNGKTAYVVTGDGVVPIRTATNTALKPIKVPYGPIAITRNGKTAYAAGVASDTVTPIRTATNTALKPIEADSPIAIAIAR